MSEREMRGMLFVRDTCCAHLPSCLQLAGLPLEVLQESILVTFCSPWDLAQVLSASRCVFHVFLHSGYGPPEPNKRRAFVAVELN